MTRRSQFCPALIIAFSLFLGGFFLHSSQKSFEKNYEAKPRPGGTLRIRPFTDIFRPQFDPIKNPHFFIIEQIYDGLVHLDKNMNIIPSLAEYWEISGDGKRYTFYLRKGVKFHNGKELTADDVKFSLERLLRKDTGSAYYQFFTHRVVGAQEYWEGKAGEVAGFKIPEKYIFEIQWKSPFVSGLYLLSMYFCKILPRDLVLSQGNSFFSKPSGTGPFKFAYWVRSPKLDILGVRLERNEQYFGKKPYLDAIEFSPHYTLDHFFDKEIDIIPFLSERLKTSECQVLEDNSFNLTYLAVSCTMPPLDRPAIRKALCYGINKGRIAQAAYSIDSVPQVTDNFIPAKLPGFFPVEDEGNYDPGKAQKILEEEGFGSEKKFPTLVLFFRLPKNESQIKIYRELKDQLEVLGIKLRMKYCRSLEEVKSSKEPYLVLIRWLMDFPDPDNIISPLFYSKSIVNLSNYSNSRLDGLLEKSGIERSWTKRIELFHQIEKILYAERPAIPLFSDKLRMAIQPYVRGVEVPPLGFYYLDAKEIWLDK